jgi:hypothetical protein
VHIVAASDNLDPYHLVARVLEVELLIRAGGLLTIDELSLGSARYSIEHGLWLVEVGVREQRHRTS